MSSLLSISSNVNNYLFLRFCYQKKIEPYLFKALECVLGLCYLLLKTFLNTLLLTASYFIFVRSFQHLILTVTS